MVAPFVRWCFLSNSSRLHGTVATRYIRSFISGGRGRFYFVKFTRLCNDHKGEAFGSGLGSPRL
jgi:hypothetical protein